MFNLTIKLICGRTELSLIRLTVVLMAHRYGQLGSLLGPTADGTSLTAIERVTGLWKLHDLSQSSFTGIRRNHDILELVSRSSKYGCTDPRDRIFALHAMARDNGARVIVDYSLDTYLTYRNFALACLNHNHQGIRILLGAIARGQADSYAEWPSWVPDWRLDVNASHASWPDLEHAGRGCLPTVFSASELSGSILEVELSYLCLDDHEPDDGIISTLSINTTSIVGVDFSQSKCLFKVVQLYRQCWSASATESIWDLLDMLTSLLPDLSEDSSVLLREALHHVWKVADHSVTNTLIQDLMTH